MNRAAAPVTNRQKAAALVAAFAWLATLPVYASAQPAEEFYRGKTIRFVVGFSPGGGFDAYARLIARHMGKHIPGHPAIIVETMSGAGSLIAANYMYAGAKADGLTVGSWSGGLILQQLIGQPGIQFDARRFEWVGVPVTDHPICALRRATGINGVAQWVSAAQPVKMGATAPGTASADAPRILREALGLPIQLVEGFKGMADIQLAIEGGEVAGSCLAWESAKRIWRKDLETGQMIVVLQINPRRHPDLAAVPNAIELVKTEGQRQLVELGILGPAVIGRAYSLPPGTPRDRVKALQNAFMMTMNDAEFLVEMGKANLDVDARSGEDVEKIVSGFFKVDSTVVATLRQLLAPKP
jgi:tripartite-type tricarboxylate transporter receptor subunit TctC